ncbi:hypothetical protein [Polyangium sp. 15x6]|uniref:hypothetical protein n=1 Tax=Polyangium sp. 15x6 TaxID=3042687 RepID=UPI00249BB768|nr:hypothetical protein [Polyangium sp. 15x6]MDI3288790.1 hypothetical protein [Polyangium sp. 15x6]
MSDVVAWVEQRIAEHRPGAQLEQGLGARVQALAEALAAITNGPGSVFGMHASAAVIAARDRLEPLLRDALAAWDQRINGSPPSAAQRAPRPSAPSWAASGCASGIARRAPSPRPRSSRS